VDQTPSNALLRVKHSDLGSFGEVGVPPGVVYQCTSVPLICRLETPTLMESGSIELYSFTRVFCLPTHHMEFGSHMRDRKLVLCNHDRSD
jgi:hypothetical protein